MARREAFRIPLLILLLLVGCMNVDPCMFAPDGIPVRNKEPLDLTVAVAPIVLTGESGKMEDDWNGAWLTALGDQRIARGLVALKASDPIEALDRQADLLICTRIERQAFEFEEISTDWWITGALWISTWWGGLFVPDHIYKAQLEMSLDLIDPLTEERIAKEIRITTEETRLSFLDRNPFLSWSTLQCLVMPPFWTGDDAVHLRRSQIRTALVMLAAQLKTSLMESLGKGDGTQIHES